MPIQTQPDPFTALREGMVASQLRARGIRDERVLAAMTCVPRHQFIADEYQEQAYEDHPIPIGEGQTISQPYIVALMTQALELKLPTATRVPSGEKARLSPPENPDTVCSNFGARLLTSHTRRPWFWPVVAKRSLFGEKATA